MTVCCTDGYREAAIGRPGGEGCRPGRHSREAERSPAVTSRSRGSRYKERQQTVPVGPVPSPASAGGQKAAQHTADRCRQEAACVYEAGI